jgi:hypothetical protein
MALSQEKYGVADMRTLEVFFKLFDLWIMLYRSLDLLGFAIAWKIQ